LTYARAAPGSVAGLHVSSASFGTIHIQPSNPSKLTAAATTKAFV
jgi:hypothetical protein